jgi:3-deoxy-manno-octulosonate cytidylyltransferase (CMP-KDO synthetase)
VPAAIIIPARYQSTRFPGKALAPLQGKPIIQHVYERSSGARLATEVVVATDSEEIHKAVESFGGKAVMTSPGHASGTDRVAEVAASSYYDIIVNVQGDEPLIRAEMIDAVIELLGDERASLGTLARQAENPLETEDPNVVKVVFDRDGFALYFSRSPIPYRRHEGKVYHHVGIYSYRREALMQLTSLEPTSLEMTEGLEQLRALEHGMRIKVGMTEFETLGVDTPEDLRKVEKWLSSSS